ncbi:MAG: arsenical-resistance protein, partial [Lentisphaeria bacterium]|nr:arsenical-resistance protein [Lentisphaeria bacterium]
MTPETPVACQRRMSSIFEKYLTVWVALCMVAGIVLGRVAPGLARTQIGRA